MTDGAGWNVVDHACRFCGGRILEREGQFWCPTCGVRAEGQVKLICGCGTPINGGAKGYHFYRCRRNKHQSPSNPSEIVIVYGGQSLPDGVSA